MHNFLKYWVFFLVWAFVLGTPLSLVAFGNGDYGKISVQQLNACLGAPDQIIIDVRDSNSWTKSKLKIMGAIRENSEDVSSWAGKYPRDKRIVLY